MPPQKWKCRCPFRHVITKDCSFRNELPHPSIVADCLGPAEKARIFYVAVPRGVEYPVASGLLGKKPMTDYSRISKSKGYFTPSVHRPARKYLGTLFGHKHLAIRHAKCRTEVGLKEDP